LLQENDLTERWFSVVETILENRNGIRETLDLCRALEASGQKEEALAAATELADYTPENKDELDDLCGLATTVGRRTWILLYHNRYLERFGDDSLTRVRLAQFYAGQDQIKDAAFQAELAIANKDAPLEALQVAYDILLRAQISPASLMLILAERALAHAPNSVRERIRVMESVAIYKGKEIALPLIEEMRQFAKTDFTCWMAIARIEAELGRPKEAKRDFEIGVRYLPISDLPARYRLIETAEKLHLYYKILEHVDFLDKHHYSEARAWEHLLYMGQNTLPNAVAHIAATNLCRIDPHHADAKTFLRYCRERKLSWRILLEAASFSWKNLYKI
jgi:tetratricopeptide (TPR) repeat protein